jgi:GMP synthase (glutamine-hydrolysing)
VKRLLVFQHVAHEILGTLDPLLKRAGFRIRYINFSRHPDAQPSLEGYDGLVILGGPMSVNDSARLPHLCTEMHLIEQALKKNLPVLGICLGAQLIAKTLGAEVYPNREKEIGWYDVAPTEEAKNDSLLGTWSPSEKIFQWHGETFDIPRTSRHLAFSSLCSNQAFRYGTKVYGFQFHLEVEERMIQRWLSVEENQIEIAALGEKINPEWIHAETALHVRRLQELSDQVFGEFIKLFDIEKKFRRLSLR